MPTQKLTRRDLPASKLKIVDEDLGIGDFTATTATPDSYNEVVDPRGADLSRFEKNAPLIDSHNYGSVANVLGKITDTRLEDGQLICTVKFAIDVPENDLARKTFAMVKAGYICACSIGFLPIQTCQRTDSNFGKVCEDLGLGDLEDSIKCVYQKWQLLELSICAIGANPDAVARAANLSIPFPQSARRSATSTPTPMDRSSLAKHIEQLTKPTLDNLEKARRGQSESELSRAAGSARLEMAQSRRRAAHDVIDAAFQANPDRKKFYNGLPRALAGIGHRDAGFANEVLDYIKKAVVGIVPDIGIATGAFPIGISGDIYDLLGINGAFFDLGYVRTETSVTKFPKVTGNPSSYWFTPTSSTSPFDSTIPSDTALTGANLTPEMNTLASYIPISRELLQDATVDLSYYLPSRFSQALALGIDYAAFSGNGNDDTTNGKQTGILNDGSLVTVNAAQGNTVISQLERADFLSALAALNSYSFQRKPRWYINPAFIAQLLTLIDVEAKGYLLKTPSDTGNDEWYLVGFPVTWVPQMLPANNTPGSIIAAFGEPGAYLVALREFIEIMLASSTGFSANMMAFRCIARAFCQTRESTGFVKLALAAG